MLARFKYERLPNFCYVCGRLDHQELDCDEVVRSKKGGRKIQREYGNWLKANGTGTVISKGCSFDQGSRSMKTGEDDSASKVNKMLEGTRKYGDNIQSRTLDSSSMS